MWDFLLRNLPKPIKLLIGSFMLALLFGYGASFMVLSNQTGMSPNGIEESYNGNEEDEEASVMKFKKSSFEILTTVHSHVFTLGAIFFITGFLTYFTSLGRKLKTFLMIEPILSLIVSFASIILMWRGLSAFKYLAYLSGALMHTTFLIAVVIILREVWRAPEKAIP